MVATNFTHGLDSIGEFIEASVGPDRVRVYIVQGKLQVVSNTSIHVVSTNSAFDYSDTNSATLPEED